MSAVRPLAAAGYGAAAPAVTTVGNGKNSTMADATVTLTLNVEAYEGVFVIPVRN